MNIYFKSSKAIYASDKSLKEKLEILFIKDHATGKNFKLEIEFYGSLLHLFICSLKLEPINCIEIVLPSVPVINLF